MTQPPAEGGSDVPREDCPEISKGMYSTMRNSLGLLATFGVFATGAFAGCGSIGGDEQPSLKSKPKVEVEVTERLGDGFEDFEPVTVYNDVLLLEDGGSALAFDLESETTLWQRDNTVCTSLIVDDRFLCDGSGGMPIETIDPSTGEGQVVFAPTSTYEFASSLASSIGKSDVTSHESVYALPDYLVRSKIEPERSMETIQRIDYDGTTRWSLDVPRVNFQGIPLGDKYTNNSIPDLPYPDSRLLSVVQSDAGTDLEEHTHANDIAGRFVLDAESGALISDTGTAVGSDRFVLWEENGSDDLYAFATLRDAAGGTVAELVESAPLTFLSGSSHSIGELDFFNLKNHGTNEQFSLESGSLVNRSDCREGPIVGKVQICKEDSSSDIVAFDLESGSEAWRKSGDLSIQFSPVGYIAGPFTSWGYITGREEIVVSDGDDRLMALSAKSGEQQWELSADELEGTEIREVVHAGGRLVLTTPESGVIVLGFG